MHVALVVGNYPPHLGGLERHVSSLAAELQSRSIPVTVFNLEKRGSRLEEGVAVIGLGRHFDVGHVVALPDPGAVRHVTRELQSRGVTHVSVHTRFFPATWLGIRAARRAGMPVTLTEHGGGFVVADSSIVNLGAKTVDLTFGKWSLRRADAVLAVSRRVQKFVRDLAGRDATICGHGIDVDWWSVNAPTRRELVFVGRVAGTKGWDTFLDVMARMPSDVTGRILGDGPDFAACRAEVEKLGLRDRVVLAGHSSPEQVRDALAGAVYLNPSTAAEGLQITLLEAAVAGARIATYDVGIAQEVKADGAAAFVVPRGDVEGLIDAARKALDAEPRPVKRDDLGWPAVADRYLAVWSELA